MNRKVKVVVVLALMSAVLFGCSSEPSQKEVELQEQIHVLNERIAQRDAQIDELKKENYKLENEMDELIENFVYELDEDEVFAMAYALNELKDRIEYHADELGSVYFNIEGLYGRKPDDSELNSILRDLDEIQGWLYDDSEECRTTLVNSLEGNI